MTSQTRAPWLATPLVAVAAFLGIMGLEVMIELGTWLRTPAFVVLLTTITVTVARIVSRQRTLPTLLGAIVAIVAMVPIFAVADDGERYLLPSPGALRDLGGALRDGIEYAATTVAPAPFDANFSALMTTGIVVLFLAAEHLAVAWRAGATAGLLLIIPWLPAVIFQHRVSTLALIAAITLWLAILALTRGAATTERTPAFSSGLVATAATLASVLLVAPTALGGLGWGMIPRIDSPAGLHTSTRLNLALDLRNSLSVNSTSPVMVYDTTDARPDALKLYTLSDFDGVQWQRDDHLVPPEPATGQVLWPVPIPDWTDQERTRLEVQVLDLPETNLPMPSGPRTIDIEGPWHYDLERDEVVGNGVTARDARYSVEMVPGLPTRESLQNIAAGIDPLDATVDARYLDIDSDIDRARVTDLADELTKNSTTRYEQALRLQSYLRDTSLFTYDPAVDPTGSDSISTFLDDRAGYCLQFATTMVVLSRTLDIPARMAVGFLPGTATDEDSYLVQGGDAHAWPELWFPDSGWVRFEPTPAIQTGPVPSYADPSVDQPHDVDDLTPNNIPDLAPAEPVTPDEQADTGPGMPPAGGAGPASIALWVWITTGIAVVAVAALWWWRMRGRSDRFRNAGPEAEWQSLRARLPGPLQWAPPLTPREAAEYVIDQLHAGASEAPDGAPGGASGSVATATVATESVTTEQAADALLQLAGTVEDHRYAPQGTQVDTAQMRAWADQVVARAQQ